MPEGYEDSDLSMHGSAVKGYALGMEGLIADWYWMRTLQYVGNKMLNARAEDVNLDDLRNLNPRLLYPYLENATDLDPHFMAAYTYGALVMPAIDAEKAIEITKKGIANNPDQWRLYQHLGYIYWKLGRYDEAADAYEQGAQIPGAGGFMRLMAATMRTEGGSRETARQIFKQMLAGTDDPAVRITAERRLGELDWQDESEAIDKVLAEFRAKNGRCVSELAEIMPMLMQVRLPDGHDFRVDDSSRLVDPTGAPYQLDHENCRVKLDPRKSGLPSAAVRTE
jgi:tetratricopeptide (TPR) repeat protein